MSERIRFNFSSAQNMLEILKECEQSIDTFSSNLCNELKTAGHWWKGESYESFCEAYSISGSRLRGLDDLHEALDQAKKALQDASREKRDFEARSAAILKR